MESQTLPRQNRRHSSLMNACYLLPEGSSRDRRPSSASTNKKRGDGVGRLKSDRVSLISVATKRQRHRIVQRSPTEYPREIDLPRSLSRPTPRLSSSSSTSSECSSNLSTSDADRNRHNLLPIDSELPKWATNDEFILLSASSFESQSLEIKVF